MSLTACRNHLIRASVEAQQAGFSSLAQVLVVTAQQVSRACPEEKPAAHAALTTAIKPR